MLLICNNINILHTLVSLLKTGANFSDFSFHQTTKTTILIGN